MKPIIIELHINNHVEKYKNVNEVIIQVMVSILLHYKYTSLETLRNNMLEAIDLIKEFIENINEEYAYEKSDKKSLTQMNLSFEKMKKFLSYSKRKDDIAKQWVDKMLSIEGKGLLTGFGFGSKKFKDKYLGNAERQSVIG